MSDLQIPAAALDAYEEAGSYRHALQIAAPLIVAAKLRQLANSDELLNLCDPYNGTTGDAVQEWLLQEADELDGAAS